MHCVHVALTVPSLLPLPLAFTCMCFCVATLVPEFSGFTHMLSLHWHGAYIQHGLSTVAVLVGYCATILPLHCLHIRCGLSACTRPEMERASPCRFPLCWLFSLQGYQMTLARRLYSDRPTTQTTDHRHSLRAGDEPGCLMPARDPFTACALLESAEAPTYILRVSYCVDIGV